MVQKYGIEIVPVVFIFEDKAYRDGVDMTTAEFYSRLRVAKKLPTTSVSVPDSYLSAYRKVSEKAGNILCITLPAKLSGMYNSARLAMEMAKESLPNVNISLLDCGTAAAAQGLVVLAAAKAAADG